MGGYLLSPLEGESSKDSEIKVKENKIQNY